MEEQVTTVTEAVTEPTITEFSSIEFLLDSEITTSETISETTTTISTAEDAVLQSVQNIETLLMYFFGMAVILIVAFICSIIIKTFFGE